ncbi:MAG: metallophosphoesterase [Clostridia bacterium]|nr:metallophosphoesterase [Clostridia bacterium]
MAEFTIADTHFFCQCAIDLHQRPFADAASMSSEMIRRWNAAVGPDDTVYHLGDVASFRRKQTAVEFLRALNGTKILIVGNHDRGKQDEFWRACGFTEIHWQPHNHPLVILSHIPVRRPERLNIHGHIHCRPYHYTGDVELFRCVSADRTGFAPILLETALKGGCTWKSGCESCMHYRDDRGDTSGS